MLSTLFLAFLFCVTTAYGKSYSITLKGKDFRNGSSMLALPQGINVMVTVKVSFSSGDWLKIYDGNETSSELLAISDSKHNDNPGYVFPTKENILMQFRLLDSSSITASIAHNIPLLCRKPCRCVKSSAPLLVKAQCSFLNVPDVLGSNSQVGELVMSFHNKGTLRPKTFVGLPNLKSLSIENSIITQLMPMTFYGLNRTGLTYLDLKNNGIDSLQTGLFDNFPFLQILRLSRNKLSDLPEGIFKHLNRLRYLDLATNNISIATSSPFNNLRQLDTLVLSFNNISALTNTILGGLENLDNLFLNRNKIQSIKAGTFDHMKNLSLLLLADNPFKALPTNAFKILGGQLKTVVLINVHLDVIDVRAFYGTENVAIYLLGKDKEIPAEVQGTSNMVESVKEAGFSSYCTNECNSTSTCDKHTCFACPVGTHLKPGTTKCIKCSAGGFYGDSIAHVGETCKKCSAGTFVHGNLAPGESIFDCAVCPEGTQTDLFAGYRGCSCLPNFYRTDRFGECSPCPTVGTKCEDDLAGLKPGFYWSWKDTKEGDNYKSFTSNIQIKNDMYNPSASVFTGLIPKAHACPRPGSCLGGLFSKCSPGYEGPLCGVCSVGYYKLMLACRSCPSIPWMIGQSLLCVVVIGIVFVFLWWSGNKKAKGSKRKLTDIFLSNLKIIIGFFQVTAGIMDAFAYVKWPEYLSDIGKVAEVIQLNVLQVAPVECIDYNLKVNIFQSMIFMLVVNASVVAVAALIYLLTYGYLLVKRSLEDEERQVEMSETRITLYRYTIVLLFIIYPGTCASITRAIPCHELCQSPNDDICPSYLRADYSVECDESYNPKKLAAYASLSYIFFFPLMAFVYLLKHFKRVRHKNENEPTQKKEKPHDAANAYENLPDQILLEDEDKEVKHRPNDVRNDFVVAKCEKTSNMDGDENRQRAPDAEDPPLNGQFTNIKSEKDETCRKSSVQRNVADNQSESTDISSEDAMKPLGQTVTNGGADAQRSLEDLEENATAAEPELLQAMSFLYENFEPKTWYWELLETIRKVLLVSCLVLIGSESRAYVGLGSLVSGLFAIFFARKQPMTDGFENRIQMLSLTVTFINLGTGVIMKIPRESSQYVSDSYLDNMVVDVLLVVVNVSVIVVVAGKCLLILALSLNEWRKNPACGAECCLAIMQPMAEFGGTVTDLAGSNVTKQQVVSSGEGPQTLHGAVADQISFDVVEDVDDSDSSDSGATAVVGDKTAVVGNRKNKDGNRNLTGLLEL